MTGLSQSILHRFRWLIRFKIFAVVAIFILALFPFKVTFTKERLMVLAEPAFEQLSAAGLPEGFAFNDDPTVEIQLRDNQVWLYADFSGSVLGTNESAIQFVATGRPTYVGNGSTFGALGRTIVTLWEMTTGSYTEKRIVFDFTRFHIVDESFLINGDPAVEFAIPAGQDLVGAAAETGIGQAVTGFLARRGADVSKEAIDAWTADTMRTHEETLTRWFANIVRNQVNGQTLYTPGESPTEQFVAASFGGFDIELDAISLKFFAGAALAAILSLIGSVLFGAGYFVKQLLGIGKDTGVVDIDEETIQKIGDTTDAVKGVRDIL